MTLRINRNRLRTAAIRSLLLAALCGVLWCAAPLDAQPRIPADDRLIRLTLPLESGPVNGTVTSYSPLLFTLTTDTGERHRILWNAIPADNVDRYWRYLESPAGDADKLYELGDILIRHRDGRDLAIRAFDQASALDPSLDEAIAQALAGNEADGSPRNQPNADPAMWGKLDADVMEQGSQTLRAFVQRTQRELDIELNLYESPRFMLLTDCDDAQVKALTVKLQEGYRTIAELLGDDPDDNVFVGKCLVVLFDNRVDYIRFQDQLHDTDARGTGGLCHGFSNGHVHIAAYNRNSIRQTNHIVIHELAHAYLRRYRTPTQLDDWVNEGLAEHLAHTVEPAPGQNLYLKSRLSLEGKQGLGQGFFEGENLRAWQYDVAGALTQYLITRSGPAYPRFINALKDGQPTDRALQSVYRMSPAKLTQRFKQRLDRELNQTLGG